MNDGLAVVGHQTNDSRVPLINDFGEGSRARAHQDLSNTVVELLNTSIIILGSVRKTRLVYLLTLIRDPQKGLGCPFLGLLIGKVPHTILDRELFATGRPDLWQDSDFEATHGEEELGVVL